MESINSIPPEKGVRFSKVHWPMHRNSAKFKDFRLYRDYEIEDGDYIKYCLSDYSDNVSGISCFVILIPIHHLVKKPPLISFLKKHFFLVNWLWFTLMK